MSEMELKSDETTPLTTTRKPSSRAGSSSSSIREFDEGDDLLSDYTSDTTFFDDEKASSAVDSSNESWTFSCHKSEGKVQILGEWISRRKAFRCAVVGPDWPCALVTYIVIIVPSIFVYLYLLNTLAELIIFFILFGICLFGLSATFFADPGLVRKYHHARSRHWTYCDHCESFRPPGTVHCSTCQVCVAEYDHHCPVCLSHFYLFLFLHSFCSGLGNV